MLLQKVIQWLLSDVFQWRILVFRRKEAEVEDTFSYFEILRKMLSVELYVHHARTPVACTEEVLCLFDDF